MHDFRKRSVAIKGLVNGARELENLTRVDQWKVEGEFGWFTEYIYVLLDVNNLPNAKAFLKDTIKCSKTILKINKFYIFQ